MGAWRQHSGLGASAGSRHSGVPAQQVRTRPIADIAASRNLAGMRTIFIDCVGVSSSDEFRVRYLDATLRDSGEQERDWLGERVSALKAAVEAISKIARLRWRCA